MEGSHDDCKGVNGWFIERSFDGATWKENLCFVRKTNDGNENLCLPVAWLNDDDVHSKVFKQE